MIAVTSSRMRKKKLNMRDEGGVAETGRRYIIEELGEIMQGGNLPGMISLFKDESPPSC